MTKIQRESKQDSCSPSSISALTNYNQFCGECLLMNRVLKGVNYNGVHELVTHCEIM